MNYKDLQIENDTEGNPSISGSIIKIKDGDCEEWSSIDVIDCELDILPKTLISWLNQMYQYVGIDSDNEQAFEQLEKAGFEGLELVWLENDLKPQFTEPIYERCFANSDTVAVFSYKKLKEDTFFDFFLA